MTDLDDVLRRQKDANDLMRGMRIIWRATCSECGATAEATERNGMPAAHELLSQGWSAVPLNVMDVAVYCPECGLL